MISRLELHREVVKIEYTLAHVQDGVIPLEKHQSNYWAGQFFHHYIDFMEFYVSHFKFWFDCTLWGFEISIRDQLFGKMEQDLLLLWTEGPIGVFPEVCFWYCTGVGPSVD